MDLGLNGMRAIICASSKGLGFACASALARAGVAVVINGRTPELLSEAAGRIRQASGSRVETVVADIATDGGRDRLLAACPDPDILVTNAGGAPVGDFRDWTESDWIAALSTNALAAIALITRTIDAMASRGFGRIVNITNIAVKGGFPFLGLSAGAVGALTGFVGGLARQVAHAGVTINNLVPGRFNTDRLLANMQVTMRETGLPLEVVRAQRVQAVPAGRLGDPAEFGDACAFLCSRNAGFITGQNWVIDGGEYPGTF